MIEEVTTKKGILVTFNPKKKPNKSDPNAKKLKKRTDKFWFISRKKIKTQ